jgi:membrane-associated phospholipid phosphatase
VIRRTALILSYLFQPLVVPSLIFLFLLFPVPQITGLSLVEKGFVLLMIFLTTFIIPLFSLITMRLTNNLTSFQMESKEDRLFPFTMVTGFYILSTYLFHAKFKLEPIFVQTLATITICLVIMTGITFFWKISAHMTGISGFLAIISVTILKFSDYDLLYYFLGIILLAGTIASSRLYLNAHTPLEVLGGFLLGFTVCFGAFWFIL